MPSLYTIAPADVLTYTPLTNGSDFGGATVVGGDTIEFQAGNQRRGLVFDGYVGTALNPIIIDLNGQSIDTLNQLSYTAITFNNCDYIKIINGTIENVDTTSVAYCIFSRTGSFEIELVTMDGGSICISIKNDPYNGTDFEAYRSSYPPKGWASQEIIMRGCTLRNSRDEASYLGASNTALWFPLSTDKTIIYEQPLIGNVTVENCLLEDIGSDAIQIAAGYNSVVNGNTVRRHGSNAVGDHKNGIQVGGFGKTTVYDNFIDGGGLDGRGMFIMPDNALVFNNVVKDVEIGLMHKLQVNSPNYGYNIMNNTFVDVSRECIYAFNQVARKNRLWNNIMHLTEPEFTNGSVPSYYTLGTGGFGMNMDERKYLEIDSPQALLDNFTDAASDDYTLKVGSTAINGGLNLNEFDSRLLKNKAGVLRPITGACNIGAY